jgi:hypothetical protein
VVGNASQTFDHRECPMCNHRLHWHFTYDDERVPVVCIGSPSCGCRYTIEGGG